MEPIKRVMWGRHEHPVTIFVPWDCGHHCPFCTTKVEYETKYPASNLEYYFERQKCSIRHLLEYNFVDDVVFTGGEPLADIPLLKELLKIIRRHEHVPRNVYVNTSLNMTEEKAQEAIRFLCGEGIELLTGISVSLPYADVGMSNTRGYELLKRLIRECPHTLMTHNKWLRVNSIVRGNESDVQIRRFVSDVRAAETQGGLSVWSINLRKDYTTCDQSNLNDCTDPVFQTLMSMHDMYYVGSGGCLVCRNDVFWPAMNENRRLTYHRGIESTSLRYGDLMVINDIVIKQDGEIRYDWNDGAVMPKCVMDALRGITDPEEVEWKWKNPLFARRLQVAQGLGRMSCADYRDYRIARAIFQRNSAGFECERDAG